MPMMASVSQACRTAEVAAAGGLIVGLFWQPLGIAAAIGFALTMIGAVGFHAQCGDYATPDTRKKAMAPSCSRCSPLPPPWPSAWPCEPTPSDVDEAPSSLHHRISSEVRQDPGGAARPVLP
ncbi:DoxX family protein [Streptomyces sp. NPDC001156]